MKQKNKCFCDFVNPCYICEQQGKSGKWLDIILNDKMVQIGPKGRIRRVKKKKAPKLSGMRKYWPNLTEAEAEEKRAELSRKQDGKCAICKKAESEFKKRLSVDHNHKTGQVRGLLCYRCNKFIVGRHDLASVTKVYEYLKIEGVY